MAGQVFVYRAPLVASVVLLVDEELELRLLQVEERRNYWVRGTPPRFADLGIDLGDHRSGFGFQVFTVQLEEGSVTIRDPFTRRAPLKALVQVFKESILSPIHHVFW